MIHGLHAVIFSEQAERLREFLGDTLGFDSVDAGGGWPIFGLPPAELARNILFNLRLVHRSLSRSRFEKPRSSRIWRKRRRARHRTKHLVTVYREREIAHLRAHA